MRDTHSSLLAPSLTRLAAAVAATASMLAAMPASAQDDYGCAKVAGTILARGGAKPDESKGFNGTKLNPPLKDREAFMTYMAKERGDDGQFLGPRWERVQALIRAKNVWRDKEARAFLVTAREEFSRTRDPGRAYEPNFLDIGCGVTISGPGIVARMTSELDVKPGEKVLEIGTGSGFQSAILRALTDKVYSIEIIPPLAKATDKLYSELAKTRYAELGDIKRKTADGYFGWEEHAPFDKIIVTAGIDHVPPPLLKQMKNGGVMVIPVGTPGKQAVLRITKTVAEDGKERLARHDIYEDDPNRRGGGRGTTFVAFTKYDEKKCAVSRFDDKTKYGCK
jgi:protein-L-isoaspartate(D-aspartate) O-methyltransferase